MCKAKITAQSNAFVSRSMCTKRWKVGGSGGIELNTDSVSGN